MKVDAYTSSAAVELVSRLSAVLIPRRTSGSDVIQSSGFGCAFNAAFRWRWKHSTMLFD